MVSFVPLAYLIITYIFSIICIQPSIGGGWSSGTYYDLDGSTFTAFNADASLWTMSAYADGTSKVSFCNNIYILGGYNILGPYNSPQTGQYFSRTYSGGALATTHNAINIMYTFQPVDSWDSTDYYQVEFDGVITLDGNHFIYTSATAVNLCGNLNQFDQEPMLVRVTIPHIGSSLTIKFISQMDQGTNDESFGVRDIYITPYVSTTTVTASLCGIATVTLSDAICACSTPKFYQSPANSGTCYPCHYNCATCTGPTSNECTSCRAGMYLVGTSCYDCNSTCAECIGPANNQCTSCYEHYFLALNSSCVEPCDWPLKRTSNSTQQYCESPCYPQTIRWDRSCVTSTDPDPCVYPLNLVYESTVFPVCEYICDVYDFLYWDQTCLEHCYFPLVNVTKFGRQFCTFPCQTSPDTILYWDGLCRSSCNFPLIPTVWKGETFCHYPCTTSQYLYWNGSCLDTCDTPLQVRTDSDTGVVYCDFPCAVTKVAYWDGSCDTSCPAPPILKSEGSPMVRYFCTFQCEIDEFLYWDGSCSDACPPPLKYEYFKSRSFCLYPCSSTEYLSYDGTCQATCNSPLTIRIQGGEKFCDLNCPGLQYLYWNGTCSDTCDSPLLASDQYFGRFCQFPCGSQTDFLYWNGTCSASCSLPYTQKTVGTVPNYYCLYPCSASEYLYYNGSCGQTCSAPLSIRVQDGLQYCDYPCTGVTPSIYLFWDGTCVSTCTSPRNIRAESALWQFCEFPCTSSSMFLYWDGSCSDYCTSPLTQHIEGSGDNIRKFCDYPCNSGEYLNFDGACITSCPSPFRSTTDKGMQFCDSPCTSVFEYYYPSDNSCSTKCDSPYTIDSQTYSYSQCLSPVAVVQEGWFVSTILTPPAGNQVTFSAVGTMTQHLRFLDINMPPRLQKLAASRGRPVFSLKTGIIMSADMQEDFPDTTLPTAFQTYNIHASFLVNFWGDLISIFIIIVAALVTIILDKISNMHNSIVWKQVTSILKYLFKWNCVIILCTTLLEDIILFSSIQFRTAHLASSSQAALFSILICCAVFILALIYVGGISYLVYQSYRIAAQAPKRVTSNRLEKFREKTSQIQVIFKGFKIDALYKHSFYIIYILRICLPMILVAYLFAYPLPQMITQTVINIAIIVYLLVVKPLEKKINLIQLLVSEFISLIINLCLLTLTSLDFAGVEMNDSMIHLGDAIIIAFYVLNISTIVFLVIKIMQEASAIRKSNPKESTLLSKITYLQLLAIPIQQCGMGFEELIDKRDYLTPKVAPSIEKVTSTVQNIIMTTEMSPGFAPLNFLKPPVQNNAVRAVTPNIENELRSTIYSQHDSFRDLLDGSVSQRKPLRFGETMNKKRMTDLMKLDESPIIKAQAVTVTRMLHKPSFVKSMSRDDILNTLGNESQRENTEPSQFWSPDPFRRNSEL